MRRSILMPSSSSSSTDRTSGCLSARRRNLLTSFKVTYVFPSTEPMKHASSDERVGIGAGEILSSLSIIPTRVGSNGLTSPLSKPEDEWSHFEISAPTSLLFMIASQALSHPLASFFSTGDLRMLERELPEALM